VRLLIHLESGLAVQKSFIASFLIFDRQSLPVVLGVEYPMSEGIVRTFSDTSSSDFQSVLQRSGIPANVPGLIHGASCCLSVPFLGKGVPEWTSVTKLLACNDAGKFLFAAQKNEEKFETALLGDQKFENFVRTYF